MQLTEKQRAAVAKGEQVRVTIDGFDCAIVRWDVLRSARTGRLTAPAGSGQPPTFWQSSSLEDLAQSQAAAHAADLDAISDLWPVDDDPDEFLEDLLAERALRRSVEGTQP